MKRYYPIYLFLLITFTIACTQLNPSNMTKDADDGMTVIENGVEFVYTPIQTKNENDGSTSFLLCASDLEGDAGSFTSVVTSTTIAQTFTHVEQLTLNNEVICSMIIHDDSVVSIDYNEEIDDWTELDPSERKLFQCIGERYKLIGDIIDSDGEAKVICDILDVAAGLCTIQKAIVAAYTCVRDRNK